MHRIAKTLCLLTIGLFLATISATIASAQGRLVKYGGDVKITLPNGSPAQPEQNLKLDQGATVSTGPGGEAYIETFPGAVATVKPSSTVLISRLQVQYIGNAVSSADAELMLKNGTVVSVLDPNAKKKGIEVKYGVRTTKGVAAAQGTAFSVSVESNGFSVAATADAIRFTPSDGSSVTIRAGEITFTPPGATAPVTQPLSTAIAANPQLAAVVTQAVQTVTTVVQNNIGQIPADSATNLVSQTVAVAVAAIPSQATTFTAQAIAAVTADGSATASTASTAAGAVTAAAVKSAPDQAAQIAGAAAQAAPGQAGVITAAAQQVAPTATDAITQQVAASTGQSTTTVQNNANASSGTATNAVNQANDATSNVVPQPPAAPNAPTAPTEPTAPTPPTSPPVTNPPTTPVTPIDPTINVSPGGG